MAARLTDIEESIEVGSLAAAGEHGTHSTLELGYLLGHGIIGGVLQAGVEVALLLQVKQHGHLVG